MSGRLCVKIAGIEVCERDVVEVHVGRRAVRGRVDGFQFLDGSDFRVPVFIIVVDSHGRRTSVRIQKISAITVYGQKEDS